MHITTSTLLFLPILFIAIISCKCPSPFSSHAISQSPQPLGRDITTILTDISAPSALINSLATTATLYTGDLTQTLRLGSTTGELKGALVTAAVHVYAEKSFGRDESEGAMIAVGEFVSDIDSLLEVLRRMLSIVASAGYTSLVSNQLRTLSTLIDEFFIALASKMDPGEVSKLSERQATVVEALKKTIAAFSENVVKRRSEFVRIAVGVD